MKRCNCCDHSKPLTEFDPDGRCLDGQKSACRACLKTDEPYRVERKLCPGCKIVKPAHEYYRHRKRRDGLTFRCKACSAIWSAGYHVRHRDEQLGRMKKWRTTNAAYFAEYLKDWLAANPGRLRQYQERSGSASTTSPRRARRHVQGADRGMRHHRPATAQARPLHRPLPLLRDRARALTHNANMNLGLLGDTAAGLLTVLAMKPEERPAKVKPLQEARVARSRERLDHPRLPPPLLLPRLHWSAPGCPARQR